MNVVSEESMEKFQQTVAEYVEKNKPVLYILTPCYGSMCYVNYMICLVHTLNLLKQLNIQAFVEYCRNDSLVSRARNNLIAKAMTNRSTTHILFIDTDITWEPLDVVKLLLDNEALVGGVYPLKRYGWEKIAENPEIINKWIAKKKEFPLLQNHSNEQIIQNNLLRYNINYVSANLSINKNLSEVRHLATGFMMIKRSTIEKMMKAFPSTKYVDDVSFLEPKENEFAYALFDCGVEEGHYLSEDWMFCNRWRNMGGKVYINVGINLTHSGIEDFRGSYVTSIL